MKRCVLFLMLVVMSLSMESCRNQESIEKTILSMSQQPVILPLEEMDCCTPEISQHHWYEPLVNVERNESAYKLVVFTDSTQCSSCFIGHLSIWNDLLEWEDSGLLDFIFIVEPKFGEHQRIAELLHSSILNHSVYLDTYNSFRLSNPQLPQNSIYHTFLLDNDNHVVIVGDPVRNAKIKDMMEMVINHQ